MKNYEELLNKSMRLGEFKQITGIGRISTPSFEDFKEGIKNALVTVKIEEKSYINIFFKYTNSISKYAELKKESIDEIIDFGESDIMDNAYITITKMETINY